MEKHYEVGETIWEFCKRLESEGQEIRKVENIGGSNWDIICRNGAILKVSEKLF